MPTIEQIKKSSNHKKFEKINHRPWDEQGKVSNNENLSDHNQLKKINPKLVRKWAFKDRPENEVGDINNLAKEFKEIGQQQPCIVRKINDDKYTHELIVGERRWLAALASKSDLLVIEKEITDTESALIQIAENESRIDLSDYAKGMSFARLIEQGLIKQKDIIDKLGKSKQYVSALLSFSKIPTDIMSAISKPHNISAGTAAKIKQLSQKGEEYKLAILNIAGKLSEGGIGWEKLERMVNEEITDNSSRSSKTIADKIVINGRHILTIRHDNNHKDSLHFPAKIIERMNAKGVNKKKLGEEIGHLIESKIF